MFEGRGCWADVKRRSTHGEPGGIKARAAGGAQQAQHGARLAQRAGRGGAAECSVRLLCIKRVQHATEHLAGSRRHLTRLHRWRGQGGRKGRMSMPAMLCSTACSSRLRPALPPSTITAHAACTTQRPCWHSPQPSTLRLWARQQTAGIKPHPYDQATLTRPPPPQAAAALPGRCSPCQPPNPKQAMHLVSKREQKPRHSLSFSASSSMASRRYSVRAKRSHSVSPSSRSCGGGWRVNKQHERMARCEQSGPTPSGRPPAPVEAGE